MDAGPITAGGLGGYVADAPGAGKIARAPVPVAKTLPAESVEGERSGRALEIFRQELKFAMLSKLGVSVAARPALAAASAPSVDDVAADALGDAARLVAKNRDVSSFALLKFRQKVEAAQAFTQQTVGRDADIDDVDNAVARVSAGLDTLDQDASRNVQSSASVLSVNSELRQRSTIRIRTQEGDVVRLDVKRANSLTATDVAVSNENGSASRTEVAVSSRSRLLLSVKGDLNDAEYAAIRNVFSQAEAIAGEFYGGDLATAFSMASGLEFDAEQLAGVNLRFRSREVTNASYAAVTASRPAVEAAPASTDPAEKLIAARDEAPAPRTDAPAPRTDAPVRATPRAAERVSVTPPADPVSEPEAPAASQPPAASPVSSLDDLPFLQFFDLLADYLQSVADGFERQVADAEAAAGSYRFHFSQSFKLEIFRSVLELTAPEPVSEKGVDLATALIEGIAEPDFERDDD